VSAYVVGKAHIDAILTTLVQPRVSYGSRDFASYWYAPNGRRVDITPDNASDIGQKLLDENVVSVRYRYNDEDEATIPGPIDTAYRHPYTFTRGRELTIPEAFLALDGLSYQSCEHPGWEASEAYAIVQGMRSELWHRLPGYSEADTWEVREEEPATIGG